MKFSLVINLDNVKQYFNYIWDSVKKGKNLHLQITILMKGRIDGRKLSQRVELIQLWIKRGLINYGSY